MGNQGYTKNYPGYIVLLASLQNISIYIIAVFILFQFITWLIIPFVAYILFLEFRLLRYSCTSCYYYGKNCAFGKGKISALFFKRRNPVLFTQKCLTWKDIIPETLLSFIPFVIGIYLLITQFSWIILLATIFMLLLSSMGNGYIRGSLACKNCKQKELGCPAEKLFSKQPDI